MFILFRWGIVFEARELRFVGGISDFVLLKSDDVREFGDVNFHQ